MGIGISKRPMTLRASDIVYERNASTLEDPVLQNSSGTKLINWRNPYEGIKDLFLVAIGSDQHDNSVYTWLVDGTELEQSGAAAVGGLFPGVMYRFEYPIRVKYSIVLEITNNNDVAYPNNTGSDTIDSIPYEGVFRGIWET